MANAAHLPPAMIPPRWPAQRWDCMRRCQSLNLRKQPICLKEGATTAMEGNTLLNSHSFFTVEPLRLLSTTGANEIILKLCLLAEDALMGLMGAL